MDKLLFEYADAFDENFPVFLFRSKSAEEIVTMIQKCLVDGIPYKSPEILEGKY